MIKLLFVLVLVLAAVLFGYKLSELEGRIIIELPGRLVQTSLLGSFIIMLFSALAVWLIFWLFKKIVKAASGSRNWFGSLSKRQQSRSFYQSINAMVMNNKPLALKHIRKSAKGDFKGTNYLIAAELERQAGNFEQSQAQLIQAMDYPEAEPLALMKLAELNLQQDQAEEAMNLLTSIKGNILKTKPFITLKLRVLENLKDWEKIETFAKENKKLLDDDYVKWAILRAQGEYSTIANKHGVDVLKSHWRQLSRHERKDQANHFAYIQILIDHGMSADAESELLTIATKQNYPEYWNLFKQLNHPKPDKAMKFIEQEIKDSPSNAQLYSVLAHLAFNIKDFVLAEKAVLKALELDDKRTDKVLLARVLEESQQYEKANFLYKGLMS